MKTRLKPTVIVVGAAITIGLVVRFLPGILNCNRPAPPGIHGHYSTADNYTLYKTKLNKDSFLQRLGHEGLVIKSDIRREYDPPRDSLRYLIAGVMCDTQKIEPYIEFRKERKDSFTVFKMLWIDAAPNKSYDRLVYEALARRYFDCFEAILRRNEVLFD